MALSFVTLLAHAQPALPEVAHATSKAVNFLSWTSPYEHIRSIAVQRSPDSVFNWQVIGFVKDLNQGPQAFIDGHPIPGRNFYRLEIVFSSDLHWFSNSVKLHVDSNDIKNGRVLPPTDSLQKYVAGMLRDGTLRIKVDTSNHTGNIETNIVVPTTGNSQQYSYERSLYVYTDPFTGHVNVSVGDPKAHMYAIQFYDGRNNKVLFIPHVGVPELIIDKRNFQKKGLYKFELIEDQQIKETGFVTIY